MTTPNDDSLLTFPCDFPIKVFGLASPTFEASIISIVKEVLPHFNASAVKMQESGGGKYHSLTLTVHVNSRETLDEIYRRLTASPLVLMAL
jgi:putative lipoic acid-binding regulatory protein